MSQVMSLLGTLNYKGRGEFAPRLRDLLGYFASEILELMHAMDADALARLIEMVDVVNEQWLKFAGEDADNSLRRPNAH